MPARAWRAISRSEIRRQTQTIMMASRQCGWLLKKKCLNYKYESLAFAINRFNKSLLPAGRTGSRGMLAQGATPLLSRLPLCKSKDLRIGRLTLRRRTPSTLRWRATPWGSCRRKKTGSACRFFCCECRSSYLTCLPIRPASSNIDTCGLPNSSLSLASALMLRLFAASCRLLALM